MTTDKPIPDEHVIETIEKVLKPLGTSLRHYMPVHKQDCIEAMRAAIMAAQDRQREKDAKIASSFAALAIATAIRNGE